MRRAIAICSTVIPDEHASALTPSLIPDDRASAPPSTVIPDDRASAPPSTVIPDERASAREDPGPSAVAATSLDPGSRSLRSLGRDDADLAALTLA